MQKHRGQNRQPWRREGHVRTTFEIAKNGSRDQPVAKDKLRIEAVPALKLEKPDHDTRRDQQCRDVLKPDAMKRVVVLERNQHFIVARCGDRRGQVIATLCNFARISQPAITRTNDRPKHLKSPMDVTISPRIGGSAGEGCRIRDARLGTFVAFRTSANRGISSTPGRIELCSATQSGLY